MRNRTIKLLQSSFVAVALAFAATGLFAQPRDTNLACTALDPIPPCDCTENVQCYDYVHPNCYCDAGAGARRECVIGAEWGLCRC